MKYGRGVRRLLPLLRRYGLDLLILLLAAESLAEVTLRADASDAPGTPLWFSLVATSLIVLPLLARRLFPFAAPASIWVVAAALSLVDGRLVIFTFAAQIVGALASYLLGHVRELPLARAGLALTIVGAVFVTNRDPTQPSAGVVFAPLMFAVCWLAGFTLRARVEQMEAAEERAARAERERDAAARIAAAEERARIARELHDVVAHATSVMVLQTGAVRHRLPPTLTEEATALQDVERTGRAALVEMRRLLGAMRQDDHEVDWAPRPGLDGIGALVARVGETGLPVHLHVEGEPVDLPAGLDVSAFRIVQESLTNVLKHAHAARADVTVTYAPEELRIEVRDDGQGATSTDGLGHGLVGIGERVKVYGGELTAGPAADGGFVVSVRLPIEGPRA